MNQERELSAQPAAIPARREISYAVWKLLSSVIWLVLLALLLIVVVIVGGRASPNFLVTRNIENILMQTLMIALMAAPMALVVAAGGIDLSVGAVAALVGVAIAQQALEGSPEAAFLNGMSLALLIGFVNGVLTGLLRINGAIVTLGMMTVLRGISYGTTEGRPVVGTELGFLTSLHSSMASWALLILLVVVTMAITVLLQWTPLRSRPRRGSGENGVSWLAQSLFIGAPYVLSAVMAGFAGAVLLGRLGMAAPTAGTGYEVDVVLAALLGGTALGSRFANVIGAALAVFVIQSVNNILILTGVEAYTAMLVKGAALVIFAALCHLYFWAVDWLYLWVQARSAPPVLPAPAESVA